MVPAYLNSSTSSHEVQPYTATPQAASCLSSPAFSCTIQDQGGFYLHKDLHHLEYQQEANNSATDEGSHDNSAPNSENNRGLKFSLWKKEDGNENRSGSAKWTCSKMRVMGRMMIANSDHMISSEAQPNIALMKFEDQKQKSSDHPMQNNDNGCNSSSSNSNSPIRVCSDCNTTKTPLWRSGPRGPKSLCNACGIRQRKARKAMAAAAAAATTTEKSKDVVLGAERSSDPLKIKLQHKAKRSNNGHVSQYKKRSKLAATSKTHGRKKLCFEDFLISLSKNLAIQQVFPQDEKEAAILLMALSCGLVHG
ncbi:hypothetical protein RHSIM_Rhsim05G0021900 [Rhododendron simsii]|uniref:GATA-type domain-containing protein n=1 Tax=Rhododendron simsii TaxID=118357 RepID=A0A834GWB3_RHOSS|nr:hypothetical protein RHSIM_Rhsim05G0021900 [Rhododendron simsii]